MFLILVSTYHDLGQRKFNITKRTVIPHDIVDWKNEHFKKADRSKSVIADLKKINENVCKSISVSQIMAERIQS